MKLFYCQTKRFGIKFLKYRIKLTLNMIVLYMLKIVPLITPLFEPWQKIKYFILLCAMFLTRNKTKLKVLIEANNV